MTNDHGVRVDGRIVQLGDFQWMAESSCFAEGFAAHIRKAIKDAVAAERKRVQKWLDVGQNEMDRAYNGIAEGREWRDG